MGHFDPTFSRFFENCYRVRAEKISVFAIFALFAFLAIFEKKRKKCRAQRGTFSKSTESAKMGFFATTSKMGRFEVPLTAFFFSKNAHFGGPRGRKWAIFAYVRPRMPRGGGTGFWRFQSRGIRSLFSKNGPKIAKSAKIAKIAIFAKTRFLALKVPEFAWFFRKIFKKFKNGRFCDPGSGFTDFPVRADFAYLEIVARGGSASTRKSPQRGDRRNSDEISKWTPIEKFCRPAKSDGFAGAGCWGAYSRSRSQHVYAPKPVIVGVRLNVFVVATGEIRQK